MILPLFFLLLPGSLAAGNRESYRLCQSTCISTTSKDSALCKCDADCQVFDDCYGDYTPPSPFPGINFSPLPKGVKLECISTYLNTNIPVLEDGEAFVMVSTCPDSWIKTEGGITAENCTSPNSTTTMPPVTSTVTGMVYRNEYCAFCNGVRELVAWQTNLVCNQRVYNLLKNKSISEIIQREPDIFKKECQNCAFQTPSNTTSANTAPMRSKNGTDMVPRSCFPRVSSCLPQMLLENKTQHIFGEYTYDQMEDKCASGVLNLVRGNNTDVVYRNVDCAICNGENVTECFKLPQMMTTTTIGPTRANRNSDEYVPSPPMLPYTITLRNLGLGVVSISTSYDKSTIYLECPEGTAPVGLECRPTQCPEGYIEMGGRCSFLFPSPHLHGSNITMENCSSGIYVLNATDYIDLANDRIILAEYKSVVDVMDYDEFGRPIICMSNVSFLDCPTLLVPLNDSDYAQLGNSSIIVYKDETVEVMFYDEHGRPLVCSDNTTTTIITIISTRVLAPLPGLQEITYIFCSLSILGSILILLTYTLFSEYRTLPGLILMNLCTTILVTNLIFITGDPAIKSYPVKELCTSLAIILHFSNLTQFAWMSIFSFEIVRKFCKARQLLTDSKKTKQQLFVVYFCIGWSLPLLVTATCITLHFSTDGLVLYGVDKDGRIAKCWINHFESFIIAFIIPLVLSLCSNLFMFILTTFLLCRASRDQSKMQTSSLFALTRVWLAVLSTTGVTWIFGFAAISDRVSWMWYPFVIFNSTQGLTVFLAFLFTKNTFRLCTNYFLTSKRKVAVLKN